MNRAILMGRLTRDPEVRYSQAAEPMAIVRFSVAVNRRFRREGQPEADFINCTAFGKTGEFIDKYFKKGAMIAIEGTIQTGSYEKEGRTIYTTDVIVDQAHFTGSRAESGNTGGGWGATDQYSAPAPSTSYGGSAPQAGGASQGGGFTPIAEDVDDDDLPF